MTIRLADTAPVDNVIRARIDGDLEVRDEGSSAGYGTIFGHFCRFNTWTEINSWEGKFREMIAPGAAKKTLKENRGRIQCLYDHGYDPQIGDKPLGAFSVLKEDDEGGYYETPLAMTSYNSDIAELVRCKALRGNSFRFRIVKEKWVEDGEAGMPERTILEFGMYECGPVTFPAYLAAEAGIRSRSDFAQWRNLSDNERAAFIAAKTGTPERVAAAAVDAQRAASTEGTEPPAHSGLVLSRDFMRARLATLGVTP